MTAIELVLGLLVAVALLVTLARRVGVPYPILLVLGGLLLGFVPGLPPVQLTPDLVLVLFLPPILFSAAYFTSFRDFRANLRPIALLAFGLVLATTVGVAVVVRLLVPEMPWPAAFALGAIVSPPDAIAATAIAQRLGVRRRIVVILEGESLVNDATALIAYRAAVAAVGSTSFSLADEAVRFAAVGAGGVAIGLAAGWLASWLLSRVDDPPVEVLVSMLIPFGAFLPAESLHVSGVLAVVTAGLILGRDAPRIMSSSTRVLGSSAWQMLLFALNGLAFILIGLQLPYVVSQLAGRSPSVLLALALLVSLAVILLRIAWVYPATYLPRRLSRRIRRDDPAPARRDVAVVAWAGMRGAVSLAAALALPPDFPERPLILFLTFAVILATLVGQGLSLPWVIRWLDVRDDGSVEHEEAHARHAAVEAALDRIERLEAEWPTHRELIDQLRAGYRHRLRHVDPHAEELDSAEQELYEHALIRRAVLEAEREAVLALRDRGAISDDAFRRVERDLDLEELRMEA